MKYLLLLLLTGCATPLLTDIQRSEFMVNVHQMTPAEVHAHCISIGAKGEGETIGGCAEFNMGTLRMYITAPTDMQDSMAFQLIGHELWHGVAGQFHK